MNKQYFFCLFVSMICYSPPSQAQIDNTNGSTEFVQTISNRLVNDYQHGGFASISEDIKSCYATTQNASTLKQCLALDIGGTSVAHHMLSDPGRSFPYLEKSTFVHRIIGHLKDAMEMKSFKTINDLKSFIKVQCKEIVKVTLSKISKKD